MEKRGLMVSLSLGLVSILAAVSLVAACTRPAPAVAPTPAPPSKPAPAPVPAPAPKPTAAAPAPKPAEAAAPKPAAPAAPATINIFGSPAGTMPYVAGQAAAQIAKRHGSRLRITSAETPGYIYNLNFIEKNPAMWTTAVPGTTTPCWWLAAKGKAPFETPVLGVKFLMSFAYPITVLATLNPNIKTLQDLVGKKVALGYPTQIGYNALPKYVFESIGILNKIKIEEVGTMPAVYAVLDGRADACILSPNVNFLTGEFYGGPDAIEMTAAGKQIYWLEWGKENIETTVKKTGLPISNYVLRKGSLKWQDRDLDVMGGQEHLFVAKDVFPEDVAYEFVKLHLDYAKEFGTYLPEGKGYGPDNFKLALTKQNIHPGALRAFEEAKVTIPQK